MGFVQGFLTEWMQRYTTDSTHINSQKEDVQRCVIEEAFKGSHLVDIIDNNALRIGAINTIHVDLDGKLHGTNTDGYGFLQNVLDVSPGEKLVVFKPVSQEDDSIAIIGENHKLLILDFHHFLKTYLI